MWMKCSPHRMEDETQHVIKQQQLQQQSTQLCIDVKLPVKETMRAGKQELVVACATQKMAQLEESSELCICKIGVQSPADKEMEETIPEIVNVQQQQPQKQQQSNKSELCTGCVDKKLLSHSYSLVNLPTCSTVEKTFNI